MTSAPADDRATMQAQGMGLAWWAKRDPHRAAIVSPKGDRTFAELNARANQLARALRARGVSAGDSVALMCGNRPEFAETINACLRIGVRMTPINWHLTADETAYILEDCEAVALVADADLGDVPRAAAERVPGVRVRLAVGGPIDGFEDYEDALGDHAGDDIDDPTLGTSMLYTSGTTGRPKGVHARPPPEPRR
ncbi:MAG: AMP-binding protein [Ilumatobacteraceae bacterium]